MQKPTPSRKPEPSNLEALWRELAAAERFHALNKPGEALARAQVAIEMAHAVSGVEARTFEQLLRSRMTTYRGTKALRNEAAKRRSAQHSWRDLESPR